MMFGFRDPFVYFECDNCECLQISDFPENMSRYYPDNYYSLSGGDEIKYKGFRKLFRLLTLNAWVFDDKWYHPFLQKFYTPVSLRVLKGLGITADTRILDVGCGNGKKFLYPLAELGKKNIAGCDPFLEKDIIYANGLGIRKGDIFDMEGSWDIITYHHVFEHVPDPLHNLKKANQLLSGGGICILRMPTVSSYAWKYYGINWVQLDAPRHFYLHSLKSIEWLARQAGFSLLKTEYDSTYKQFSDSEAYIADKPLRAPRPKGILSFVRRKIRKHRHQRLAAKMNVQKMGDQAAFFLKKVQ